MRSYVGRFAPTPSGALHLGSLSTALGSYLDARAAGGRWLLRIDDLDRLRVRPGAEDHILRQLDAHGLNWDGPIHRQSTHTAAYESALNVLREAGSLYACHCTRAQLALVAAAAEDDEPRYPGTCRDQGLAERDAALRYRVGGPAGGEPIGDFVVRRRDGQIGYQLACAVDEWLLGITDVVRGADLAASAARQSMLLKTLGHPVPEYRHLPLLVDASGQKLGKRNESRPLEASDARENLQQALSLLQQAPVAGAEEMSPAALIAVAVQQWRPRSIPRGPLKAT